MNTKVKAALILDLEKSGSCSICRIVNLIELIIIETIKIIYKSIICSNGVAPAVELGIQVNSLLKYKEKGVLL
jgi:hypothetical protein